MHFIFKFKVFSASRYLLSLYFYFSLSLLFSELLLTRVCISPAPVVGWSGERGRRERGQWFIVVNLRPALSPGAAPRSGRVTVAREGARLTAGTPLVTPAQSGAVPSWSAASPRTGFVWSQNVWNSRVLPCWCFFQRLRAGKDPLYSQFYLIILSGSRAACGSSRWSRKFRKRWCQFCVCVLGFSQTDHPGWGTWVETRDFYREDVQSRIQTLQHGAGLEGSFPV